MKSESMRLIPSFFTIKFISPAQFYLLGSIFAKTSFFKDKNSCILQESISSRFLLGKYELNISLQFTRISLYF